MALTHDQRVMGLGECNCPCHTVTLDPQSVCNCSWPEDRYPRGQFKAQLGPDLRTNAEKASGSFPAQKHWAQLATIESSLHDRYEEGLADGQDHEACDTPNHCYCPCETCHVARAIYLLNTPDTKEDRDRRLLFADSTSSHWWVTDKHAEIMMAVLKAAGVARLTPCYAAASSAIKGHQVIDRAFSEGRTVSVSYPAEY